ncbi:MAG: DUF1684 domain-containing protein [Deltaproteobacteria bacterium]|nr:DUF1684 domain-containing protein [Deltaproteobacteria bacterium]
MWWIIWLIIIFLALVLLKFSKTLFTLFVIFVVIVFMWYANYQREDELSKKRMGEGSIDPSIPILRYELVMEWRKERDKFFKTHERSPLTAKQKKVFAGLEYYPFDLRYIFSGLIERYHFYINDPKYYVILSTNKGTQKRYIRYGKFHFRFNSKEYAIEIYKSILSDFLLIPFKDETNRKETYEGGRYIDAEILANYKMVLDFNMAYHPPCAYNSQLVCALPPRENILEISIPVGEKNPKYF